eukprot:5442637-Prymnesium_polylepis.1
MRRAVSSTPDLSRSDRSPTGRPRPVACRHAAAFPPLYAGSAGTKGFFALHVYNFERAIPKNSIF